MKKESYHKKLVRKSYVVISDGRRALLIPGGSEALKDALLRALSREERKTP